MKRIGMVMAALLLLGVFSVSPVCADVEIGKLDEVFDSFTIGGDFNVFYRYDSKPWFGLKMSDLNPGAESTTDTSYGETFNRLRFTATKDIGWATLSGQFAPYYAETVGQDFYPRHNDAQEIGIDQAWLKFAKIGGTPIDLTLGRQDIKLEKWFVVGDGDDQEAANWLYFVNSFPFAAKLDGDFGALKASLFHAEVGDYVNDWTDLFGFGTPGEGEKDAILNGLSLHYDISDAANVYAGVYQKDEAPDASLGGDGKGNEDDTIAYDIGFDVTFAGLQLEGEYVMETGDTGVNGELDREADAYFAIATYRFGATMAPYVRAGYISYSGDDPDTSENEEYDPMFSGFETWNRWIIGELIGETHLPNQNKKDLILEAGFSPMEPMTISLMFIQHTLDEEGGLSSDQYADEWNLFVDWPVGDHLFASAGFGYVTPGDAAKEILGEDDDAFFTQLFLSFYF